MPDREHLGEMVTGPTVTLAARVKALLEADPEGLMVKTEWGNFYVGQVELRYYYGGDTEVLGYLVPDEGEGNTFDFYTAKPEPQAP